MCMVSIPGWGPEINILFIIIRLGEIGNTRRGGKHKQWQNTAAVGQRMTLQFLNLYGVLMVFLDS